MNTVDMPDDCSKHPYLSGNFAPIHKILPLTACSFQGSIPKELEGGQYVRNGANPLTNADLGRDAHWFDGDGMLSGVLFDSQGDHVVPKFVNQFILTDVLLAAQSSPTLRTPILPSIATLVSPTAGLLRIIFQILRTVLLVAISFFQSSVQSIKRISAANTSLLYHDGRALATCESGPPMRISLPTLETVGWFNGHCAEGELQPDDLEAGFGGTGVLSFMREWTTGHPKVDPVTKEMILYHCSFVTPYVHYSVLPPQAHDEKARFTNPKLINLPVPGVSGAKMMHDFGVSRENTVIMDLPLSLDPFNLMKNKPIVHYNPGKPSRYGVFPRRKPQDIRWFETDSCCIFHSANTWDEYDERGDSNSVNMLVCRLTSASLVFVAGNLEIATTLPNKTNLRSYYTTTAKASQNIVVKKAGDSKNAYETTPLLESQTITVPNISEVWGSAPAEPDQCRLYYYKFDLSTSSNDIRCQFALSAIPFDFPVIHPDLLASKARYIYGCSTTTAGFAAALGKAVKIDVLAKVDTTSLIKLAQQQPPEPVNGCVDNRSIQQIVHESNEHDNISLFRMPKGWYAQEARFVPRDHALLEDDGYLIFYAFDESQLNKHGELQDNATSELWVVDAKNMRDVVCRVMLPQRVPYGLHGCWFPQEEINAQRPIDTLRTEHIYKSSEGMMAKIKDMIVKAIG